MSTDVFSVDHENMTAACDAWRSAGEFYLAVHEKAVNPCHQDCRLIPAAAATGSGIATDSAGGFLVPQHFDSVQSRAYLEDQVLRRCRQIPNGGKSRVFFPRLGESSRDEGSRYGGARVYRVGEGDTITATTPLIAGSWLQLHRLAGLVYVTDEMLDDSMEEDGGSTIESYLDLVLPLEYAYVFTNDIINGTGSGQMLGLLRAGCKVAVDAVTNQTAGTFWGANALKMNGQFWGPSHVSQGACWLVNPELAEVLPALSAESIFGSGATDIVGTTNFVTYGPNGGTFLLGKRVLFCEQCPAVGTEGDVILTDLSDYCISVKSRNEFSSHVRFAENESAFRFTWSVNGQPLWDSALTPDNGSSGNLLSTIVTVANRA